MAGVVRHRWMIVTAQAWPFCSASAFDHAVTSLTRTAPGVPGAGTRDLAHDLDEWLRTRAGGLSTETLRQYREGAWFSGTANQQSAASVPLSHHVLALARAYLEWRGHRTTLRQDSDGDMCERALRWRWLTLLIPEELLVAALAQEAKQPPPGQPVALESPHLKAVLQRPLANTHYHWGSALRFCDLWTCTITALAHEPLDEARLRDRLELPFGSAKLFCGRLMEAGVVRLLLAAFLWHRHEGPNPGTLSDFVSTRLFSILDRARIETWGAYNQLEALVERWRRPSGQPIPLARLHLIYRALCGPRRPTARSLAELSQADPLCAWLTCSPGCASVETRFTTYALGYLHREPHDALFATLFWQYQRVRCLTHRFLTLEPGTAGLDWFVEHYRRVGALRGALDQMGLLCALEIDSQDAVLGATEPRTSPGEEWQEVRDTVRAAARQVLNWTPPTGCDPPEVGLVLHFTKDSVHPSGKALHADPGSSCYGTRYGAWFARGLRQMRAIRGALARNPELLLVLRGVDIANVEHAVPFWACQPLLRKTIQASTVASNQLAFSNPSWRVPPLRLTVHAGEDFRRLVSGLRAMHEPLEFGTLRTGDRLGHGLALGLDCERWAQGSRLVFQPREERLDDLLWELERYGTGAFPGDAGRMEQVRREVLEHGKAMYSSSATAETLLEARRLRFCEEGLEAFEYPLHRPPSNLPSALSLHAAYLSCPNVFRRGQEAVGITCVEGEVTMLALAQAWLRRALASHEITIESNPSSNLVIGDLENLEDHPSLTLMPLPNCPAANGPTLPVSINTDNPMISCTSLANEYAHMYYGLLRLGTSSEHALQWLEQARQAGWRSRFTLQASRDRSALQSVVHAWERRQTFASDVSPVP